MKLRHGEFQKEMDSYFSSADALADEKLIALGADPKMVRKHYVVHGRPEGIFLVPKQPLTEIGNISAVRIIELIKSDGTYEREGLRFKIKPKNGVNLVTYTGNGDDGSIETFIKEEIESLYSRIYGLRGHDLSPESTENILYGNYRSDPLGDGKSSLGDSSHAGEHLMEEIERNPSLVQKPEA